MDRPRLDTGIVTRESELKLANDKSLFSTSLRAATPLKFSLATDDTIAMPHEVIRRGDGVIVIHVFRRPDVPQELGERVVQKALTSLLGGRPPEGTDLLYRDEEEIKRREGLPRKVMESDSWYIELPRITSLILPDTDYLRNKLVILLQEIYLEMK